MDSNDGDLRASLETAIYREIGARDFYGFIAKTITNPEGIKRFTQLSKDEEGHRTTLESRYEKLFGTPFEPESEKLLESEIKGFKVEERTSAIEALDIAIEAESRAAEFYGQQAGATSHDEVKQMFLDLAEMEMGHYNLLVAERNQLVGGFYWFDMDSSGFMED
ncbi:MAG: ferritin family protein [Candidatus Krumholzibacteria bacterium]|nr:ferritin family protein [Candidatus Krumholzibacteria bacterium]